MSCFRPEQGQQSGRNEKKVVVNEQHAFSLIEMVKWFKGMVNEVDMPAGPDRSDKLTTEYCNELIGALTDGD
jgi:hypothetical protein